MYTPSLSLPIFISGKIPSKLPVVLTVKVIYRIGDFLSEYIATYGLVLWVLW